MGTTRKMPPGIKISPELIAAIEDHAHSNLEAEVGGMIFGHSGEGKKITVVGFVPALSAEPEQMQLKFSHQVWDEILTAGENQFPGAKIVGWYHTHPNFGVFLSEYDSFIQENFFREAGQFALVIDPIKGQMGWFRQSPAGEIEEFHSQETLRGPAQPRHQDKKQTRDSKLLSYLVPAAAAVTAFAVGLGVSYANAPIDQTNYVRLLESELETNREFLNQLDSSHMFLYTLQAGETVEDVITKFYEPSSKPESLLAWNPSLSLEDLIPGTKILLVSPKGLELPKLEIGTLQRTPSPTSTDE